MSEHVLVSRADGVLRIQLNRPEKKNALTRAMYGTIADALEAGAADEAVRAVLIAGTADCFCAGNDIGQFQDRPAGSDGAAEQPSASARMYLALATYEKPVVAAVGGLAIGIGTTMLLHCDLVYASTAARFRTPFVDLGLVPELGSSLLLPRLAGRHRAAELMLLGDFFDAQAALDIGLVTRLCAPDALTKTAEDAARRLAAKPPFALRATKALLRRDTPEVLERIREETAMFSHMLASPETQSILSGVLKRAAA